MTFAVEQAPRLTEPLGLELLYIVGEPGSGKSTLVDHLTRGVPYRELEKPFAYRLYSCGVFELGKRRPDYPGTDALSMSVQPRVLGWLETHAPPRVLAEGARLGNKSFLGAAKEIGYRVTVVLLKGKQAADLHRRIRGSTQSAEWVDGRRTAAYNVAEAWDATILPAGQPLAELEHELKSTGNPVIQALRGI
jgi:energy-coupling factor transporter ATP-binding protein EcfA2